MAAVAITTTVPVRTIVTDIATAITMMTTTDIMAGDTIANGEAIAHGMDAHRTTPFRTVYVSHIAGISRKPI